MTEGAFVSKIKSYRTYADWPLLGFLLLFIDVKLGVKLAALLLIYLLRPDLRFRFNLKNSRLPLFYVLIFIPAIAAFFANANYRTPNYLPVYFSGACFWLICLLAAHQIKLAVEKQPAEVIHHTIQLFFIINGMVSVGQITLIMWHTGSLNPYLYQGEYQKYFLGTGDYIRGIAFDTSTTNAVLNAFGVIYFLEKKNTAMLLGCMAVLLLTGSNLTNLVLSVLLIVLFAFRTDREQKSLVLLCLMCLVLFLVKISPQNNAYATGTVMNIIGPKQVVSPGGRQETPLVGTEDFKRAFAMRYLDSIRTKAQKARPLVNSAAPAALPKDENGRLIVPGPDINTPPYQTATDTDSEQKTLLRFIVQRRKNLPISGVDSFKQGLPGKAIAILQTLKYLPDRPAKLLFGDGVGNFSSKIAYKATGLGIDGGYPANRAYISPEFLRNHLDVYLNFFSKRAGLHSILNSPDSVYDQLLAEYGLCGLLLFFGWYLGFFLKHSRHLTYGLPLLALMLPLFGAAYWFEQLSVVVFFELLLFLDIKKISEPAYACPKS